MNPTAIGPSLSSRDGGVRAVERAVELLFRLAAYPDGVGLQQLARDVGCSKSTVHRLLATLQGLGVADQDAASRLYRPGGRLAELTPVSSEVALRRMALPIMRQLRDDTEETVTLHLVEGGSHVVVEQIESEHEIRRINPIGQPVPLLTGATARAILAFMPPQQRSIALSGVAVNERPPADELDSIRRRGYSLSAGERLSGGTAMSAPIIGASGHVCAALSVSGPRFRFSLTRAARFGPALVAAAQRLSAALGDPGATIAADV